nr:hypothetical protein [Candidatus Njordarchaeota archaeon]
MTSESTKNLASALIDFSRGNERLEKAEKQLAEFTKRFPFRNDPKLIQKLTPNDIYEKGSKDSFFYWVEFGTFDIAHLKIWGARNFENVKTKLQAFKNLLAKIVDDSLRLYMKVDDAGWDTFAGFGGDRHIAKKIIALFYPEKALPISNTKHLEHFATKLGINFHHCIKRDVQQGI